MKPTRFITRLTLCSLISAPVLALDIINQYPTYNANNYITITSSLPQNPTNPGNQNVSGGCNSTPSAGDMLTFSIYNYTNPSYSWSSGAGNNLSKSYLCFKVTMYKSSGTWVDTYTNPLADTGSCVLEITGINSSNALLARATPDCKYSGLCPAETAYSATDSDCCPKGHWNGTKCE